MKNPALWTPDKLKAFRQGESGGSLVECILAAAVVATAVVLAADGLPATVYSIYEYCSQAVHTLAQAWH
ncbi:MAG TPA: hypothetical protein VG844_09170 [Terracidiphilus sp.]|jgi:Flp pilus assembly pilin Flp|nr:hypothetical protein [Terracidiphilus sp.]